MPGAAPCSCGTVRPVAKRYKDRYGNGLTVITAGVKTIIYRRDGYDMNCEMRREKFLEKFIEVEVKL
ncbi:DUF4222 domain-containing protein [Buttiauxella sp. 3AFRM03]|uniref:DUF4222 domain-containing protein n=1 Tax=Buttiauxella sp. 3AFRM03 TaxID=2479367 RepID=UPI003513990E